MMIKRFDVVFLEDALVFLKSLDIKESEKILYSIRRAQTEQSSEIFKKLNNDIWEFRIKYNSKNFRFLAFWDKDSKIDTVVITTHGFVKKSNKVPIFQIHKAINLKLQYFNDKQEKR
jgi:phage-related protein